MHAVVFMFHIFSEPSGTLSEWKLIKVLRDAHRSTPKPICDNRSSRITFEHRCDDRGGRLWRSWLLQVVSLSLLWVEVWNRFPMRYSPRLLISRVKSNHQRLQRTTFRGPYLGSAFWPAVWAKIEGPDFSGSPDDEVRLE